MSQQDMLFGVTTLILAGTLITWVVVWLRGRKRGDDEPDQADRDGWPR